jgi:hypothetical protein
MDSNKIYLRKIVLILVCISIGMPMFSQKKSEDNFEINQAVWEKKREIGFNFTNLVHSLVPFNLGLPQSGFVGIRSKVYDRKYAFRNSFGTNLLTDDVANNERQFFYAALGYERRRIIGAKWSYTSGWDLYVSAGVLTEDIDQLMIGPTRHYGLEYNLNARCYISTESQILFGFGEEAAVKFIYPTALNFIIRL